MQKATKNKIEMAATIASIQSHMLKPQKLFDELASDSGAKKHTDDHPIQEVLNLGHALVPITQRTIYAVVSFSADGFVDGKLCFYRIHDQNVIEPEAVNW